MVRYFLIILLAFTETSYGIEDNCVESITKISGSYAPNGKVCANRLLFNENFDKFNTLLWRHEVTMWGGYVCN